MKNTIICMMNAATNTCLDGDCRDSVSKSIVVLLQLVLEKSLHYLLLSVPVLNQVHLDPAQRFQQIFLQQYTSKLQVQYLTCNQKLVENTIKPGSDFVLKLGQQLFSLAMKNNETHKNIEKGEFAFIDNLLD